MCTFGIICKICFDMNLHGLCSQFGYINWFHFRLRHLVHLMINNLSA